MRNLKPKYKIDKFRGMSDNGGTFYIDGFSIENENGVMSLDESYHAKEIANKSTTNFSTLGNIMSKIYIYSLPSSSLSANTGYTLMFDGTNFYTSDSGTSNVYKGKIGGQVASGTYKPSYKPDLFQLPSGNILFTSSRHLGLIVRGTASASSTTQIKDSKGRDLSALGLSNSAPNNKVVNLKTGVEYTITSVSGDTINFSAGTQVSKDDEFMAFAYTRWDLNTDITVPAFAGQPSQEYWTRQIKQLAIGDKYYISNGNMLAWLADDETTLHTKHFEGENKGKLLPVGYQLIAFEVNGAATLVSAVDNVGRGHLLLWDGYSDGWLEIMNLDSAPTALSASSSGWVFLLDGVVYFTDGYNIKPLITWSEKSRDTAYNTTNFNGITSLNGTYYFCVKSSSNYSRSLNGVMVFNPNTGLSLFKTKANGIANKIPYSIDIKTEAILNSNYYTNPIIEVAGEGFYNQIQLHSPNTDSKDFRSFVYFIDFGDEVELNVASLSIKRSSKLPLTTRNTASKISVNYGDNTLPVISYGKANVTGVSEVTNVNGVLYPGVVGQEIEFTTGNVAGQRTFIQSISNANQSNETWAISPALSTTGNDCEYRAWCFKNGETKTISLGTLREQEDFPISFIGDKLWLEIVVNGVSNSFPISIDTISLS